MLLQALASFLILLAGLNFWGWHLPALGLGFGLCYLVLVSYSLGGRLKALLTSPAERLGWGFIVVVAAMSVLGTAAFYLHLFSAGFVFGLCAVLPWLGSNKKTPTAPDEPLAITRTQLAALAAMYFGLLLLTLVVFTQGSTDGALRSPWQTVPGLAFLLYALACACALALTRWIKNPWWLVPLYAVTLSVLPVVYALGYGFDPFIHQAAEKLLASTGTIAPTPLYYVGQYTTVVGLNYILALPLTLIDKWLLPLFTALALPFALAACLRPWRWPRQWLLVSLLWPLVFTLPGFTYTTPQGFANLWAVLAVLLIAARLAGSNVPRFLPWLAAAAAVAAHPLTGLPVLGIAALWWFTQEHKPAENLRRKLIASLGAATALVVPFAFVLFSFVQNSAASVQPNHQLLASFSAIGQSFLDHLPMLPAFAELADTVAVWAQPLPLLFLVLTGLGFWYVNKNVKPWRFFAWIGALITLGYLVLKLGATFPNLPSYEQDFYTSRLWDLALLCWWPLALAGTYQLLQWVLKLWPSARWWVVGSLLLTAGLYLSYPRLDFWRHDTAYNTTPADVAAVQLIDSDGAQNTYVVLANQAVSAAAISTFGFKTYYNGNFYYPVPTGANPLYEVYHQATEVATPTHAVVQAAATISGVSHVYLVLNRYWSNYLQLVPVAAKESNQKWVVANDQIEVFRYDF